jgi:hypothetical protein
MNKRLPHDYKSVTRALAQDYKIKCAVASGNGSLKELTRGWKQAAMSLKATAKDGSDRKLTSYRRTLHNNFNQSLLDLQILGSKNCHSSLLISYGTFPGSERQDIFIGGTSGHINEFFRLFSRANASALGCALQSFQRYARFNSQSEIYLLFEKPRFKIETEHADEMANKWLMLEAMFRDPRIIDFSGCINMGKQLQMFRPGTYKLSYLISRVLITGF